MVLRQQGLSLAKTTSFGHPVANHDSDWSILRDRVSGLETDTSRARNIYLMTDAADRRPILAMGEPGKAIDLSIRLNGYTWESSAVTALLRRFNGTSLDCLESRRLGAGAWLDDWADATPSISDGALIRAASRTLRECEWLEVEINSSTHRNIVRFTPSFIDSEGGVIRVADRACRHVIYADVEAPDFRLQRLSGTETRMFRECTGLSGGAIASQPAA